MSRLLADINARKITCDVVAAYNLDAEASLNQNVDLKTIARDERRSYLVWEFWSSEYVGWAEWNVKFFDL